MSTSQVLRILPRSGRIAWKSLSRACLALPPAESPSTRNSSVRDRSCEMQSASLPGRAGPCVTFLRTICFSVFRRALARSIASCAIFSPISMCWLSHSENASCAAPSTKPAAWRERQAFLGLAAELRIGHLQRQHEGDAVPHVFRRELDAARQQVAEIAELAQRIGQAGAQAVDVRAVLRGRDQVDVAFLHQLAFGHPGHGPVDDLGVLACSWPTNRSGGSSSRSPSSPRR